MRIVNSSLSDFSCTLKEEKEEKVNCRSLVGRFSWRRVSTINDSNFLSIMDDSNLEEPR